MSEYQYYEFLAVDRALSAKQIDEIRAISTRANITPTSFVNEYQWGDFNGDPTTFIVQYFDAMLYFANWGTHQLMLGLPEAQVDAKLFEPYVGDVGLNIKVKQGRVVLDFVSDDEGMKWEEGADEFSLATLSRVREEILRGDLRALYLGWLSGLSLEMDDAEGTEPPLPAGMKKLSAAQEALADFLRVDADLLEAAAEASDAISDNSAGMEQWIAALPTKEKDALLLSAATGQTPNVGQLLARRFAGSLPKSGEQRTHRTIEALLQTARRRRDEREEAEQQARATERARADAKRAEERKQYLRQLSGRQDQIWKQVNELIAKKQSAKYDEAVSLLCDLKDVAIQEAALEQFQSRVRALRAAHAAKSNLMTKLNAKLPDVPLSA